ncbi:RAMP superfamily CRISPR-associated protein [Saccharopolyspora erythraea]|uniref:RAMP superfamily CRISPR-associated protein n=1 Tax=Saccharopolyspora erythraea TaxID=1836 RepID=UPI0003016A3B|nr:RAMP superfamily CRISPR-associated protein [Saccharopolyspora erythraea]
MTLITARLRFETAGGVGGTEAGAGENGYLQPIRRDPAPKGKAKGKVSLPGTTIAGSLRAHCAAFDAGLGDLFGDTPEQLADKHGKAEAMRRSQKRNDEKPERAMPSAIQVLGTLLHRRGETFSHTRNSSDRKRGAARTHHFHRVEMLETGTEFDVVLRWDNADEELLERFLDVLKQWHPTLGRGVTRGAGRCSLVGWGRVDYDLDSPDGLMAWLNTERRPNPAETPETRSAETYALDVDLSIVDAIHCGTELNSVNGPKHNTLTAFRHGEEFVVPGSTLKGVLRSRAEYICRVLGLLACKDQQCGECRPCLLFGFAGEENARRGRIAVDDAVIEDAQPDFRPHVAIDRFTGGARDQALYEHEVVAAGWFPMRVRWLGTETGAEAAQDARLLHAVVADLDARYVGIGARTTAGFGTVAVRECRSATFEVSELAGVLRDPVIASTEDVNA